MADPDHRPVRPAVRWWHLTGRTEAGDPTSGRDQQAIHRTTRICHICRICRTSRTCRPGRAEAGRCRCRPERGPRGGTNGDRARRNRGGTCRIACAAGGDRVPRARGIPGDNRSSERCCWRGRRSRRRRSRSHTGGNARARGQRCAGRRPVPGPPFNRGQGGGCGGTRRGRRACRQRARWRRDQQRGACREGDGLAVQQSARCSGEYRSATVRATPVSVKLKVGRSYALVFTREGYHPVTKQFRVTKFPDQEVVAVLRRDPSAQTVQSNVPAAAPRPRSRSATGCSECSLVNAVGRDSRHAATREASLRQRGGASRNRDALPQ